MLLEKTCAYDGNRFKAVDGHLLDPGEICERVNLSDWEGTEHVGDSIFGSSAWPEASLIITFAEIPGVYAVPDKGLVCASDHVSAAIEGDILSITNPTGYPARLRVMIEREEDRSRPLGLIWQEKFRIVSVPAGGTVRLPLT